MVALGQQVRPETVVHVRAELVLTDLVKQIQAVGVRVQTQQLHVGHSVGQKITLDLKNKARIQLRPRIARLLGVHGLLELYARAALDLDR